MTGKELQKAMSDINDDFILEASPDQVGMKTVPIWRRRSFRAISGFAAACLVLAIGINTYQVRQASNGKAVSDAADPGAASVEYEEKDLINDPDNACEAPVGTPSDAIEVPADDQFSAHQITASPELQPQQEAFEIACEADEAGMADGEAPKEMYLLETEEETESVSEAMSEAESDIDKNILKK